jgi:hypothetical protein
MKKATKRAVIALHQNACKTEIGQLLMSIKKKNSA